MKTRLVAVAGFAALVIGLLSGCQGEAAQGPQASQNVGKIIYDQQCSICHGKTGKGDTMIASSYTHANLADEEWGYGGTREDLIRSVTEGIAKTPMRGFRGALTQSEIEQVVDYVLEMPRSQ